MRWFLLCIELWSVITFVYVPAYARTTTTTTQKSQEELYEIDLNNQDLQHQQVVLVREHDIFLPEEELKTWRLKALPVCVPLKYDGEQYYALRCFPGGTYRIDSEQMALRIKLPARYFSHTAIAYGERKKSVAEPPEKPGAFLNYDVETNHINNKLAGEKDENRLNGLFDAGFFTKWGVAETGLLYRNWGMENKKPVRLNSSWIYDNPESMWRFRLGDSTTEGGRFGRALTFGGVQFGRNFQLQPEFYPYPLPLVQPGEAVVPSVVDLYLNNTRLLRRDVPPGPFDIQQFPVYQPGPGTIRVVTQDLFGNERAITIPFYFTRELLQKGLHQYSFSAGWARRDYGLKSFNYSRLIATGMDRFGVTDHLTLGSIGELSRKQQMLGGDIEYLPDSRIGVFTIGAAGSRRQKSKTGVMGMLAFDRRTLKWNFGFETKWTTHYFTQFGYEPDQLVPVSESRVSAGRCICPRGNLGVSFVSVHYREHLVASQHFLTLNYSQGFWKDWLLQVVAMTNLGGEVHNKGVMLYINHYFGERKRNHFSLDGTFRQDNNNGNVGIGRRLPEGPGWGYRLSAGEGDNRVQYGQLSYRNNVGTYYADAAYQKNSVNYRLNALGGAVYFDKNFYLTRYTRNSFAVVEIPPYQDVRVYRNSLDMGKTSKKGKLFVPDLSSYSRNQLRVNPNDLPINVRVDKEMQEVVPYYRSGVVARFPAKPVYAATFRLVLPSGKPVPGGAIIKQDGKETDYFVADDGEVYLENLAEHNELEALSHSEACDFVIDMPKTDDPLPELGNITCHPRSLSKVELEQNKELS